VSEPKLKENSRSGLIYRYRDSSDNHGPPVILLHGLGGDENSMWVLEYGLLPGGLIVAPRALYETDGNGYSWVKGPLQGWPTRTDFAQAVTALIRFVDELEAETGLRREELFLMGFSQGAALAFAAATDPALRPKAIIAAAGFLPMGDFTNLKDLPIFWGHGFRDEWIPIEKARSDAKLLRDFGADVKFCETDVKHKLGLECLEGLKDWMEGILESRSDGT
jgi:phospholipase/carboxylesterase